DSFGTHPLAIPFEITLALDSCLDANPSSRPSAATLQALLRQHILAGKHNGRLVHGSRTATINSSTRSVRVNAAPVATFTLEYNDLDFLFTVFSGDICVKSIAISQNYS